MKTTARPAPEHREAKPAGEPCRTKAQLVEARRLVRKDRGTFNPNPNKGIPHVESNR